MTGRSTDLLRAEINARVVAETRLRMGISGVAYGKKEMRYGAMRWEKALAAANRIEVRNELIAYALSYRYLDGGPALLSEREQTLRQTVSLMPEEEELPTDLGRDLFAWMTAISIAQRRSPWDLPPSWSDPESGSR